VPFRVEVGESIVICGNCLEFGNWRVQFAFPLTWTPGNIWTGELRLDPGNYEFKVWIRVIDHVSLIDLGISVFEFGGVELMNGSLAIIESSQFKKHKPLAMRWK